MSEPTTHGTGNAPAMPDLQLTLLWTMPPAAPEVSPHAQLLHAVAAEVHRQPFGSYARPELAAAADELLAALQSQLPRETTAEVPAVPADFDERAAAGTEGVQVGSLIATFRSGLFNGDRALAHLEAALAGAVGVAWGPPNPDQNPTMPGWEQCSAHLLDDLRTGRTEALLDPAAIGTLIFPGDDAVVCATCTHGALSDARDAAGEPRRYMPAEQLRADLEAAGARLYAPSPAAGEAAAS